VLDRRAARSRPLDRVQERLLGDDEPSARVLEQVLDLLRARAVVERERHRAEVHRRGVHKMEFGPVHQHQRERVPPAQPERRKARSEVADAPGVLPPCDRHLSPTRPQRLAVALLSRRQLEQLADRAGAHRRSSSSMD
jgi:hypothetical protein